MCVGDSGSGSGVGPADGAGVRRVGVVAGPDSGSCGRSPRVVSLIATPGALLWDGVRIPPNHPRGDGPRRDLAFTQTRFAVTPLGLLPAATMETAGLWRAEVALPPAPTAVQPGHGPLPDNVPPAAATDTPLPINLATALQLSNARPLDVQIAGRQVAVAAAVLDRAKLLWVPNLVLGIDYFGHTGLQQN